MQTILLENFDSIRCFHVMKGHGYYGRRSPTSLNAGRDPIIESESRCRQMHQDY